MRLLCVEDDRVNAMLLEQSCLAAGLSDLQFAETGQEALLLAAEWQPDLLVLDLHLPDTDGYALLTALRQALKDPTVPAVLCSADAADALRGPAAVAGFQAIWSKPVSAGEVRATLAALNPAR